MSEPLQEHDAPEVIIKHCLRNQWGQTHVNGVTPRIHFGWLDQEYDEPEVTISEPNESPTNAGNTGYAGIDPTGGPPHVDTLGTVRVNSWCDRPRAENVTPAGESSHNPRQLVYLMGREIQRIVQQNALGADSSLSHMWWDGSQRIVDDEGQHIMFRTQTVIGYAYDY